MLMVNVLDVLRGASNVGAVGYTNAGCAGEQRAKRLRGYRAGIVAGTPLPDYAQTAGKMRQLQAAYPACRAIHEFHPASSMSFACR
jgi:hypothetical protein